MTPRKNKCDTCKKALGATKMGCGCRKFRFCDDNCYSERPMRSWHREECERVVKERKKKEENRKKAALSHLRSIASSTQPRNAKNGQFGKKDGITEEEQEKLAEINRLNSNTTKAINGCVKYGRKLDNLRKSWGVRFLVYRTEKGAKSNPVIYESKGFSQNFLPLGPARNSDVDQREVLDDSRNIDLSFDDQEEILDAPRKPIYRCYVCSKTTGIRKGFVCGGLEDTKPCTNGAACQSCINLDMTMFTSAERKKIKGNWRCPAHKKKSIEDASSVDEENDAATEAIPYKKPKKPKKLFTVSNALKELLPVSSQTKSCLTRSEVLKGVHLYIKSHPEVKEQDIETKKWWIIPDDALCAVYGREPFMALSTVPKIKDHIKDAPEIVETSSGETTHPCPDEESTTNIVEGGDAPPSTIPTSSTGNRRSPKKFLNPNIVRASVKVPPRLPNPPKGKKSSWSTPRKQNGQPGQNDQEADLPRDGVCVTCHFHLDSPEDPERLAKCGECGEILHHSCLYGYDGCVRCSNS